MRRKALLTVAIVLMCFGTTAFLHQHTQDAPASPEVRLVIARQIAGLVAAERTLAVRPPIQALGATPRLPFYSDNERVLTWWANRYLPNDSLKEIRARILAREFDIEELRGLLTFYQSPVGRRFVGAQGNISKALKDETNRIQAPHRKELLDSLHSIAAHGR